MVKELNRDVRNRIIDLINQQSTNFDDLLSELDSLFTNEKYTSFETFREEFNNFGRFSYWMIEQISFYSKDIKSLFKGCEVLIELDEVFNFEETKATSAKNVLSNLSHDFSRYLFSLRYITSKIKEKQTIAEDISVLFEPVLFFNAYKYYNFDGISDDSKKCLLDVFSNNDTFVVLKDNFEKINHPCRGEYLKAIDSIELSKYLDWNHSIPRSVVYEEQRLLELLSVKYDHKTDSLQEMMNFGSPWPDYKKWKRSDIEELRGYFNNRKVDLIVDLILNILICNPLSQESEKELLTIVESALCDITHMVPPIVYFAFKRIKSFSEETQKQLIKISISKTESLTDIKVIEDLKESGIVLNKKCISILNTKNIGVIKNAIEADNCNAFIQSLSDIAAFKDGTNGDLKMISKQFQKFELGNRPDLYIAYMRVLNYLKSNNKFDISWINEEIVRLIYYWQNHGYKLSINLVKEHIFSGPTISRGTIENIQKSYLTDPRTAFFGFGNSFTDDNILQKIKNISEYSMSLFVDTLYLLPDFPKYKSSIGFEKVEPKDRTEIENILFPFFDDFITKNKHHLLNLFPTIVFIKDIVEKCDCSTLSWEFLYEIRSKILTFIKKARPMSSIGPYHKKPTYADLTMLFPLLEKEVLHTGASFGFPPLITENNEKFGTPNSPAETLLKLIRKVYEETDSLYLASDFIWIYLLMYCREGLNIRNNVIHGNNYPFLPKVINHYYTITLICLADLIKRNDNFKNGVIW